ncbi:MAG: hypothetical protein ACR2HJ_09245 [Fimbriimonadales bacterium]
MQILASAEGQGWLAARGLNDPAQVRQRVKDVPAFKLESASARKTALARGISLLVRPPALLWIDEHDIWQPEDELPLVRMVRNSFGESRTLYEAPGHLFDEGEADDLAGIVALVLYNDWGALLYEPSSLRTWIISHDEFLAIEAKDETASQEVHDLMRHYGYVKL